MSVFDLTDKVAVVTGGGSGIGRSIALEFAKAGANVVVASRRADVIDKAAAEIQGLGRRSLGVQTDVIQTEQVQALVSRTLDEFGTIDILVNNAGGAAAWAFDKMSPRGWDVILSINLKGTFLCSQAVGKLMVERKQGKIINISSVAGLEGAPGLAGYCATKGGIRLFSKAVAKEFAGDRIRSNSVHPGIIDTPIWGKIDEGGLTQTMDAIGAPPGSNAVPVDAIALVNTPLQRAGQPEEIAAGIVFLASDESSFITGSELVIDGGWTA